MCEWKPDFDGLNERVTKALAAARLRRLQEQQAKSTVSVTVTAGQEAR